MFIYVGIPFGDIIDSSEQLAAVWPTGFGFDNGKIYQYNPDQYKVVEIELPTYFDKAKYKYVNDALQYINEEYEIEDKWRAIRDKRDALLLSSDKLSGIRYLDYWEAKTQSYKDAWVSYRNTLRDIPQTFTNPDEVTWPTIPE
jgi:hypothetical protein